jgi:hypothetical protein
MLLFVAIAAVITTISFAFTTVQPEPKKLKNIKVFPATATYREVDHAMDQFKVDLGVKCNYCHAPSKENPRKLDMASDENPLKDISRDMMRMTAEMNKKYIAAIPHADTVKVQMVTCNTCHRGATKPFGKSAFAGVPQGTPPPPPPPHKD